MELISIGFLLGVIFSIIVFASGVLYGSKNNKGESTLCDSDSIHCCGDDNNNCRYVGDDLK